MKPTSKLSFKVVAAIFRIFVKIISRWEIKGKENLPASGGIIAVCNHVHLLDPVIHIISILPRNSIFMAKEELFHVWPVPFYPVLMNIAEAFPAHRLGTPQQIEESIRRAENVLAKGHVFGIYPEGMRSTSSQLKVAYRGAARIALRSGAPLIPVGIYGTEKLKGIGWIKRPRITVTFGKPFDLPGNNGSDGSQLQSMTGFIMEQLCTVLPPEYHGRYGDQSNSDSGADHDVRN